MADENIEYEVQVIDAYKCFGKDVVLNGLNMNIPSGIIYGLLGPSGCGKSTLLQCILGTDTLDYGCIDLKAKYLKDVGYMPQDLSLDGNMSIKETFEYYGTIYKMSKQNIKTRINELNKFLHFPNFNSYINEISGGQSKRISLAIALIHNPKLIILDEPTVGIDVLLRQEIWVEFLKMTEQYKKTIVITTHYIEEAGEAKCIGLMRKGILIAEGSPQDIITQYRANTLEESFLLICCGQHSNKIDKNQVHVNKQKTNTVHLKSENTIDFYRVKALSKKYFRSFYRDFMMIFSLILLPLVLYYNFNITVGTNIKDMSIAIKNDEVNYLDCQHFNVHGCIIDANSNLTMSCLVLNYLMSVNNYKLVEVNDHETGELSMKNPNYMAFLYFPKTYTRALAEYISGQNYSDSESLVYARLTMDNFIFRSQIKTDVLNSINYLLEKTIIGCFNNPKVPINFNTLYGYEIKSLTHSVIHIFIGLMVFHISSSFSGGLMISEKLNGTLKRSIFSGVKLTECLLSLFFLCTILQLYEILSCYLICFVYYSNPIEITSSLFAYVLLLLFLGWIGFFLGILIAILSKSQLANVYLLTGIALSQFMLPGIIWPLEGQIYFLRVVSKILPIRVAVNSMTNIALKGWTLQHPSIITGSIITFGYTMLLVLILIILARFKKNMWISK